jgi:hypothetical protein
MASLYKRQPIEKIKIPSENKITRLAAVLAGVLKPNNL